MTDKRRARAPHRLRACLHSWLGNVDQVRYRRHPRYTAIGHLTGEAKRSGTQRRDRQRGFRRLGLELRIDFEIVTFKLGLTVPQETSEYGHVLTQVGLRFIHGNPVGSLDGRTVAWPDAQPKSSPRYR